MLVCVFKCLPLPPPIRRVNCSDVFTNISQHLQPTRIGQISQQTPTDTQNRHASLSNSLHPSSPITSSTFFLCSRQSIYSHNNTHSTHAAKRAPCVNRAMKADRLRHQRHTPRNNMDHKSTHKRSTTHTQTAAHNLYIFFVFCRHIHVLASPQHRIADTNRSLLGSLACSFSNADARACVSTETRNNRKRMRMRHVSRPYSVRAASARVSNVLCVNNFNNKSSISRATMRSTQSMDGNTGLGKSKSHEKYCSRARL